MRVCVRAYVRACDPCERVRERVCVYIKIELLLAADAQLHYQSNQCTLVSATHVRNSILHIFIIARPSRIARENDVNENPFTGYDGI